MKKKAVFAGGCFWGMEDLFRTLAGVLDTEVGYSGGDLPSPEGANDGNNPTYENHPGYAEALQVEYDDEKISYRDLLDFFFQIHNPTTRNRQGNDIGDSYRSAIFYQNQKEKKEAEQFIQIVNDSGRWKDPVVTSLEPLTHFYRGEDYHQDYLVRNPGGYTCHTVYFDSYINSNKK